MAEDDKDYKDFLSGLKYLTERDTEEAVDPDKPRVRKTSFAREVSPYYGGMEAFLQEASAAAKYNYALNDLRSLKGLLPESYNMMLEDIPVVVGSPSDLAPEMGYAGGFYSRSGHARNLLRDNIQKEYPLLGMTGREQRPFMVTPTGADKMYQDPDTRFLSKGRDPESVKQRVERSQPRTNVYASLTPDRPLQTAKEVRQHEISHQGLHSMRQRHGLPSSSLGFLGLSGKRLSETGLFDVAEMTIPYSFPGIKWGNQSSIKVKEVHTSLPDELLAALGQLQRQTYAEKKSRLKPGELSDLILSNKNPEHLDQGGLTSITYARNVMRAIDYNLMPMKDESESYRKEKREKAKNLKGEFLKRLEELVPSVVEAEDVGEPSQIRRI